MGNIRFFLFMLGHECLKAVCVYRGHCWSGWFAMDSISDGFWKLCGLLGLIMEAISENNSDVFILLGIKKV